MTLVKDEGQRRGKNGLYRLKTHLKTTLKILKGGLYISISHGRGESPGGIWVNFCWVCAADLSVPLPHYSLFFRTIIDPILVTFEQICIVRDPNLVTIYFYELTHF